MKAYHFKSGMTACVSVGFIYSSFDPSNLKKVSLCSFMCRFESACNFDIWTFILKLRN